MLLSWLSEETVRYEVFCIGVELIGWDFFESILLLILHAHTLVYKGKFSRADLLSYLVSTRHRIAFIKLQQLQPLSQ